jgi:hypothetical protein
MHLCFFLALLCLCGGELAHLPVVVPENTKGVDEDGGLFNLSAKALGLDGHSTYDQ